MTHIASNHLLGVGLYSVSEASRLSGVASQRIRRWIAGYQYTMNGEKQFSEALWHPQIEDIDHTLTVGFQDLMEIRFVSRFVQAGVSLYNIRKAFKNAQEIMGTSHPFSARRFQTDGRSIFIEVANSSRESNLLDLVKSQFAFKSVISPSFRDLDYSENDELLRWWPMGRRRKVVVDPGRAFGQPIISKAGIPTATLATAAKAQGSVYAVAKWFEIGENAVRDAVEFEESWAA